MSSYGTKKPVSVPERITARRRNFESELTVRFKRPHLLSALPTIYTTVNSCHFCHQTLAELADMSECRIYGRNVRMTELVTEFMSELLT